MDDEVQNPDTYRISGLNGLLILLLSVFCWLWLGRFCIVFLSLLSHAGQSRLVSLFLQIASTFVPFLCLGLGLWLSLVHVAHMPLKRFVTEAPSFRWKLSFAAAGVTVVCYICFELIGYLMAPDDYLLLLDEDWGVRLATLPLFLILVPIQTSCEELLFRCFPTRWCFGTLPRTWGKRLALCILSAGLFVLPHLANPDLLASAHPFSVLTYYALFGGLAMASALATDGFEIALGIHAANNLYTALLCNYTNSPLPSVPLMLKLNNADNWQSPAQLLLTFLAIGAVVYFGWGKSRCTR